MSTSTITTADARTITAQTEGDRVVITIDGVWAGEGRLARRNGLAVIEDCAAVLADDPDESDDLYAALERSLA